jgi:hypothetical protein
MGNFQPISEHPVETGISEPALEVSKLKKKPVTVVVTSPHAECVISTAHSCDKISDVAAKLLVGHLEHQFSVKYFQGNLNRQLLDLNRAVSRHHTIFRTSISRVFESSKPFGLWLFDIHSYPQGVYHDIPSDCVLLLPYNNRGAAVHNDSLYHWLVSKNISVLRYHGSKENDILLEATEYGYELVFLLELSELLTKEKLDFIMKEVADWATVYDPK